MKMQYTLSNIANYSDLSAEQKIDALHELYINQQHSFVTIAKAAKLYPNKLRRDAIKFKIPIRDRSEAQSLALSTGRHKHPTKGTERDSDTKVKISNKMAESWSNLSEAEKEKRSEQSKKQWDKMSDHKKAEFKHKAAQAIRQASRDGSKLEKFLYRELLPKHHIEYHKEHLILNDRLHIDLFFPILGVAVEVDGPSHFKPIWGQKTLTKNQRADNEKNGLLLKHGFRVIRIKQTKALSEKTKRETLSKLNQVLENLPDTKHVIEIEV